MYLETTEGPRNPREPVVLGGVRESTTTGKNTIFPAVVESTTPPYLPPSLIPNYWTREESPHEADLNEDSDENPYDMVIDAKPYELAERDSTYSFWSMGTMFQEMGYRPPKESRQYEGDTSDIVLDCGSPNPNNDPLEFRSAPTTHCSRRQIWTGIRGGSY